ncbi:hypothetical protein OXPF_07880 [Oxobacter pfennigii]|uniref:Uncharacterized protein n=1 Tax=Oxobacter pfennigii TaxID=36849 RepID=A0A0P9AJH5_9CLOT|nr:hypothetical protein OXPF_07880 [Oxobacter pfennigii]
MHSRQDALAENMQPKMHWKNNKNTLLYKQPAWAAYTYLLLNNIVRITGAILIRTEKLSVKDITDKCRILL